MSTTIDSRVVEMQFDNKRFEQNVATSMSTLEKLKQSLNLTGAAKGLDEVGQAAKRVDLSGLSAGVDAVQVKFSYLQATIQHQLNRIVDSAVNAGKRMVSALTIDPIKTGFNEYELKMGSVQTIMASTGESLETVNKYLEELNKYSDMTIYSFSDMTQNIGKFTNAGVKLEDAVAAIQGISNEAALAGANSNEASRAMYNFAQALSSGYVKLIDWKSIENANMATVDFKDQLIQTAVALGTVTKSADGTYKTLKGNTFNATKNFNDVLQDQWMTSEVLVATLKKYADTTTDIGKKATAAATEVKTFSQLWDTLKESAQSGWAQSWELIVGDFEEAKKLLTNINNVVGEMIGDSADARNNLIEGWKEAGGRDDLIQALSNAFEALMNVIKPIKKAFEEIFPPITVDQLVKMTEGLKKLTEKFVFMTVPIEKVRGGFQRIALGADEAQWHNERLSSTIDKITRTFKGLFAVAGIIAKAIKAVVSGIFDLVGIVAPAGDGILTMTANVGDWLIALNDSIESTDIFNKAVQSIVGFIEKAVDVVKKAVSAFKAFANQVKEKLVMPGLEIFHDFLEKVHERMSGVADAANVMKTGVGAAIDAMGKALVNSNFFATMQALWNGLKAIGTGLLNILGKIGSGLVDTIGNANFSGILDFINTLSLSGIAVMIAQFVKGLKDTVDIASGFKEGVIDILDGVKGCLEGYQSSLKADALKKIAVAIAILAASIFVIALIDSDKLADSLGAITVLFADLMASMALFGKMTGQLKNITKSCIAMTAIAISVFILAAALKKIAELDSSQMLGGLIGVAALSAIMVAVTKSLSSSGATINKGAVRMIIFALAIKVLASACADLAELSWDGLAKGLIGVGVLLASVAGFMKLIQNTGNSTGAAIGILLVAAAMKVLASAVGDFAGLSWEEIAKGLVAVGALLLELGLFSKLVSGVGNLMTTGVALIAIAAAMKIFASAMADFGSMSWEEIAKGLVAMGVALLEITLAVNFMPKDLISTGVGLIAVSAALLIVAQAMSQMGSMSWGEIARGLVALGGSMAILAVGLNVMNGTLAGAAALLVATAALAILAPVLSILGAMSWESIFKGLVALAGAFVVIGAAGVVLAPITPAILALAGSIALIGVAVLAAGTGLVLIGAGLSAVALGFTALATAVSGGATMIVAGLTVIITGLAALIPAVVAKIGEGIIVFCQVIIAAAPAICAAFVAIVTSVAQALLICVPTITNVVLQLLLAVLTSIAEYAPQIVQKGIDILISLLEAIANNLSKVIQTAVDIVIAFIDGIAKSIPKVIQAGFDLIISFLDGLTEAIETNTPILVESVKELLLTCLEAALTILSGGVDLFKEAGEILMNTGLIKGIADLATKVWDKITEVVGKAASKISEKFSEFKTAGGNLINKIVEGIKNIGSGIKDACTELICKAKNGITEKFSEWKTAGKDLIEGLVEGVKSKVRDLISAVTSVISDAISAAKNLLGIASPSKVFIGFGKFVDEGFAIGLEKNTGGVVDAAKTLGKSAISTMSDAISKIQQVASGDMDFQPTIRPVLDLSAVSAGANSIGSMLDLNPSVGMMANVRAINGMMGNRQNGNNDDVVSAIKDLGNSIDNMPRNNYTIDGVTYDDGSNISNAVKVLVRAAKVEGRR